MFKWLSKSKAPEDVAAVKAPSRPEAPQPLKKAPQPLNKAPQPSTKAPQPSTKAPQLSTKESQPLKKAPAAPKSAQLHTAIKEESVAAPWTPDQFKAEVKEGEVRFHDLDLPDTLMHSIADLGFKYCTPIQSQTLVYTLEGKDLIGKAQTGTGKTAAFLISIISDCIDYPIQGSRPKGQPRALIVAPTRELVMQIAKDAQGLVKHCGLS
ncbi:MAG: ATP-dependent RNA helicase RhlB, partial [Motiliproteus sp.]